MISTNYDIVGPVNPNIDSGSDWDRIIGAVLGGINGVRNPGTVTVGGSTPVVYTTTGTPATASYMPLLVLALIVVAVVVLSK